MKKLALYGYGGHAREVACQIGRPVDFFVDAKYANEKARSIETFDPSIHKLMIAVADCNAREEIVSRLPKETEYFTYIHPTALILSKSVEIGEGSFVGAYSILTTDIKIGAHAILNRAVQIGHDCKIGNYFSAMPGAVVGGNVNIGNNVYLGSCSNVREKITLLDDILVGMNAGVISNIFESGTYVGVPAKRIK